MLPFLCNLVRKIYVIRSTTFVRYEPIYLQVDEIRKDIQIEAARTLQKPRKIILL